MPDHSDSDDNQNAIAIIGMSVRLPGASNLADYWNMLHSGKEAIRFFTGDELKAAGGTSQSD
jgi:acyl transferase domain-containing protein